MHRRSAGFGHGVVVAFMCPLRLGESRRCTVLADCRAGIGRAGL